MGQVDALGFSRHLANFHTILTRDADMRVVIEAAPGWTIDDLRPYAAHALNVFGPDWVIWGSDWPVCQLNASYADWRQATEALSTHLSAADQARIFGGTASAFYRLG